MLLLQVKILQSTLKNSSTSTLCNIDSSRLLKEAGIVAESYYFSDSLQSSDGSAKS